MVSIVPQETEDTGFAKLKGNRHLLDELNVVLRVPENAPVDERRHYVKLQNTFKHLMGNYCQNTYVPLAYALAFTEDELKKEGKLDCLQVHLLGEIFEKRGFKIGDTVPYRQNLGYSDKLHEHFKVDSRTAVMNTAELFEVPGVLKEKVSGSVYDGRTAAGVIPLKGNGTNTNNVEVLDNAGRVILSLSFAHGTLPPELEKNLERIAIDAAYAAEHAVHEHTRHTRELTDSSEALTHDAHMSGNVPAPT